MIGEHMRAPGCGNALPVSRVGQIERDFLAELRHVAVTRKMFAIDECGVDFGHPIGHQKPARTRHLEQTQIHRTAAAEPIVDIEIDSGRVVNQVGLLTENLIVQMMPRQR